MKQTPDQIAARLMAPASVSALWTYDQVKALIIDTLRQERGEQAPQPPDKGKAE